jgi:small subunit ribosomal protein S17
MTNTRRRLIGRVVSDKMDKTVVVMLERRKLHPKYQKVITIRKKVMAHDESNSVKVGSVVQIVESRPLSRHKRWVVEQVLDDGSGTLPTAPSAEEEVTTSLTGEA